MLLVSFFVAVTFCVQCTPCTVYQQQSSCFFFLYQTYPRWWLCISTQSSWWFIWSTAVLLPYTQYHGHIIVNPKVCKNTQWQPVIMSKRRTTIWSKSPSLSFLEISPTKRRVLSCKPALCRPASTLHSQVITMTVPGTMDVDEEHSASAAPAQMVTQDNEETMLDEWSVLSLLKFCIYGYFIQQSFFVVCSAFLH